MPFSCLPWPFHSFNIWFTLVFLLGLSFYSYWWLHILLHPFDGLARKVTPIHKSFLSKKVSAHSKGVRDGGMKGGPSLLGKVVG